MKLVALFACFLFILTSSAQNSCLNNATIKTGSMGDGKDSISFSLEFAVAKDSVTIIFGRESKRNVVFSVLSKACHWNKDFSKGESIYEVEVQPKKRKAILKIIVNETKQVIELLYENSEPRIFNILNFIF